MKKFKNSKTAKVVSGFVGLAMALTMLPGAASAATLTASQVSAIVSLLSSFGADAATISNVQASLTGQATTGTQTTTTSGSTGYMFTSDLTIGSKGADVVALQEVLVANGFLVMPAGVAMGYFGALTKSAVAAWQASAGIAPAAGYVGPKSRAALNAMGTSSSSTTTTTTTTTTTGSFPAGCTSAVGYSITTGVSCATGAPVVVVGTGVMATLDASSPMTRTLISPQGIATLAVFKLTNGGSVPAKVTMLKMKRTGISSDSTLNNVYLYDSMGNRITDSASISTGMITFSDTAGVVTVPAMGAVTVSVRADIASSMNGQTIGVMLSEATADGVAVAGTPVSGAEHNIATAPSGIATVNFASTSMPGTSAGQTTDPVNDYTLWGSTVTVGSRDALLSAIRFQQIGSVYVDDIKNLRLMVDGVVVGTTVAQVDANRFATFTFPTPLTLKAGTHTVKLMGDIVAGSNRNFQFSLRRVVDVEVWDSQLNVSVTPTALSAAFTAVEPVNTVAVNTGTITITKATDSTSGNVVLNGVGTTLAKFKVKGAGEKIKVENLRVSHTASDVLWTGIRNGALFLDGVQVGSTATINEDSVATPYTQFSLGSSMVLDPGVEYTLEVRGDVYNTNTTANTALAAGTTTTVNIAAGSSNIYRMSSLSYFANTAQSGNQLTVAAGSIALSKYAAYANQTATVPRTAYKVSEYRLTTGSTESVNVDTLTLALGGTATAANVTDLYVVYGTKTTSVKATGATSQSWSINEVVPANSTLTIAVYGTLTSSNTNGQTVIPTFTVGGTSQNSGSAVTSVAVAGQTITVGTGSIIVANDASTPVAALATANTMPKIGSFKFTASNDGFTIDELAASTTLTGAAAIAEFVFKDGATELKRASLNGIYATATGLSIAVPANTSKVIDLYANLGGIGQGYASTSADLTTMLSAFEYMDSNGVKTRTYGASGNGATTTNAIYAYKAKPTITNVALPTTVLTTGVNTVSKFTITADGGTIAWRKIILNVATSTGTFVVGSGVGTGYRIFDAANESTALTGVTVATTTGTTVTFTFAADQEVTGSKTYVVKGDVVGTLASGSTVSTSVASSGLGFVASTNGAAVGGTATFLWSDESAQPHSYTTPDWNNDYLVKNLPTDSLTLTK